MHMSTAKSKAKACLISRERILGEPGGADAEGGEAHDDVGDVNAGGDVGVGRDGVDVGEEHSPADQGHDRDDLGGRGHSGAGEGRLAEAGKT